MPLPLFLEIHPKLSEEQKLTVRQDFGMAPEQNELLLTENAALVWILTKMWGIDVGNPKESELFFRFELKNKELLLLLLFLLFLGSLARWFPLMYTSVLLINSSFLVAV